MTRTLSLVDGALGGAALLLGAALGLALAAAGPRRADARVSLPVRPDLSAPVAQAEARQLLAAIADATPIATGQDARTINAALPLSRAPLEPARPFSLAAHGTPDASRALECLTQAVYHEAGFEPLAGRRAVAQVVLNRLRHPAFPKSVCGVVYQGAGSPTCQFSFVCDGALGRAPALGAWAAARRIAADALAGRVEASVGEATHYHADYVAPRWAPLLAKIGQLGTHIFYRWPGAWGRRAAFTGRYVGEPLDPALLRAAPGLTPGEGNGPTLASAATDPTIHRAPNDVGGLVDPTRGWVPRIPSVSDSGSAVAAVSARQGDAPTAASPPPVQLAAVH